MQWNMEDWENVYTSLSLRKNLIETGDASKDREQAVREKQPMRPLSMDQMKLLIRTEELQRFCLDAMSKCRQAKS